MHVFQIDEIRNIDIREYLCAIYVEIDNVIRLEMEKRDAEYLLEQLEYQFHKETYEELKCRLEEKITELQEEIKTLREENTDLKFGITPYKGEVI